MNDEPNNPPVILITLAVAVVLILAANAVRPADSDQLEKSIKLASAMLGFPMAVFAAVKSLLGITQAFGFATREDVVPAGVTAGAGALLVLASAIA
ncbi:MAG TPA: hypothetical protein VGR85_01130 [Candidatus Limnocylindria bacterium]|jgi:hypothetical protein|nr:hypothetical protein [Candidatus Limnocylindria bacterium]